MNRFSSFSILLLLVVQQLLCSTEALAQRVRFPTGPAPVQTNVQPGAAFPTQPTADPGWRTIPPYNGQPVTGVPITGVPVTGVPINGIPVNPPTFDGFSSAPGTPFRPGTGFPPPPAYPGQPPAGFSGSVQPMIVPPGGFNAAPPQYPRNPLFPSGQTFQQPRVQPPALQMPNFQTPSVQQPNLQQPGLQQPGFQLPRISGPSTWFDGWQWPSAGAGGLLGNTGSKEGSRDWIGRSFWSKFEKGPYLNLFQEFRFGHTYIYGSENNQLQVHETEVGTTLNYPDFLGSGEPLRISPGFIFHAWDGPQPPHPGLMADLPSKAYSTFLALDYSTPGARQLGGDLNVSAGLYTDFKAVNSNSLRFKGTGLGRLRLAPDLTMRFGINYLNRIKYKLLPAFGFFWTPTEDARIELFFPYPKIARRLPRIGNAESWAYLRGELGGDTFTIERDSGLDDQVDIVDYRILTGIEWNGYGGATGFFEGGFVFNRELIYRFAPLDNIDLDNSLILRTGLAF